jgi:ketosteroid isomerase-like protein
VSQQAVEIVRALQPPLGTDLTKLFAREAEPAVVEALIAAIEPFVTDDFVCGFHGANRGERQGVTGLRDVWLDWLEPWETYRVEHHEFVDFGDRVLVLVRDYGRRRGMTAEIELHGSAIYTVRDGKLARAEYFAQRAEAYAALGVDP